ncbi:hypothetical protein [Bacillus sp. UMB0728]|uniref:hypothetical protein n=1 Tax=Bacillus sp. UMB0728 TaxID=2066052 RepID=UPI001158D842|nr:hypothetical protein [Bacillus sp. UMB0728]
MMNFVFILLGIPILIGLYNRYIPVLRMSYLEISDISKDSSRIIIDIRDYNVTYKQPIKGAINIPVGYLNRYYEDIPYQTIHLISSNALEKNVGTRILRKKGFKVVSYSLFEEICDKSYNRNNIEQFC